MKITVTNLVRWAGLAAMGTGILFIVIQLIHPPDVLPSVTTPRWAITHYLGIAMGILGLFGVVGIYARQVEEAGWLGVAGYLLFSLFWMITTAFQFVEALLSPLLANAAPQVVEGVLAMAAGHAGEVDLGALPTVYALSGLLGYMLGGLLFGSAIFRAGILPRWAGGLLAVGVVLPFIMAGLIPHPYDRILAAPVGLALVWLGYALWSDRRAQAQAARTVLSAA